MIHLDTNYLIETVTVSASLRARVNAWLQGGEELAVSAVAWSEFMSGPATDLQIQTARIIVKNRIVPFGQPEAELAAELFNLCGRKRGSQPDCFIAASAIRAGAFLATENRRDFTPFVSSGLRLA